MVRRTMEIQESNSVIFFTSRLFGLAPFWLKRTPKGKIQEIRLSLPLCGYSVLVLATTVILTCRGLIIDANSTSPVRMTTATSKFVTSFDVIVVVGACFFGVVCGVIGLRYTQEMNEKLREVDEVLAEHEDKKKDKRKDITMLASVFVVITGMIAMDLVSRYRILHRATPDDKMEVASSNVRGYIPFYVLYFILMALHAQFAQSAFGLGRRYRRLNNALQLAFPIVAVAAANEKATKKSTTVHVVRVSSLRKPDAGDTSDYATQKKPVASTAIAHDPTLTRDNYFVDRLAYTHASLGEAVGNVSAAYGMALLAMLVSCLLHLVATSYFLFVEILGANDLFFSMLQFLWLFFHLTRLLLIVEPCHLTSVEARRTIILVCEIIRNCKDPGVVYNLKKFWRQLLAERAYYFSACGMCNIDRQILTSIAGAIATYLVILIQFQKTDG